MLRLSAVVALFLFSVLPTANAQTVDDGWKAYDAGDYETAKKIIIPLAKAGNAKAMNAIGLMHSEGKAYPENKTLACDWYEKSAKAGYPQGQSNIGTCFKSGKGREQTPMKAIFWKEKAAIQGNLNAQISLAHLYWKNEDREKAIYWWQKANNAGSTKARVSMWILGIKHEGPQATYSDIACELIMVRIIGKPWGYCD